MNRLDRTHKTCACKALLGVVESQRRDTSNCISLLPTSLQHPSHHSTIHHSTSSPQYPHTPLTPPPTHLPIKPNFKNPSTHFSLPSSTPSPFTYSPQTQTLSAITNSPLPPPHPSNPNQYSPPPTHLPPPPLDFQRPPTFPPSTLSLSILSPSITHSHISGYHSNPHNHLLNPFPIGHPPTPTRPPYNAHQPNSSSPQRTLSPLPPQPSPFSSLFSNTPPNPLINHPSPSSLLNNSFPQPPHPQLFNIHIPPRYNQTPPSPTTLPPSPNSFLPLPPPPLSSPSPSAPLPPPHQTNHPLPPP